MLGYDGMTGHRRCHGAHPSPRCTWFGRCPPRQTPPSLAATSASACISARPRVSVDNSHVYQHPTCNSIPRATKSHVQQHRGGAGRVRAGAPTCNSISQVSVRSEVSAWHTAKMIAHAQIDSAHNKYASGWGLHCRWQRALMCYLSLPRNQHDKMAS
jgi:hypothetical protein